MIVIQYLTRDPRGGSFWIADAIGHNGGVWVRSQELAKGFDTEADAKGWLVEQRYDLPAANVVFQPV